VVIASLQSNPEPGTECYFHSEDHAKLDHTSHLRSSFTYLTTLGLLEMGYTKDLFSITLPLFSEEQVQRIVLALLASDRTKNKCKRALREQNPSLGARAS
jgi:hypothetical protein